ncbi:hypothetical protein QN362_11290 [Actimicrobium sp. CCC2.4]|uniref:hypothetical protein n=1 Tax=Actimicrobium sp. CCC2.4 TaxID=3048606 RepID=UPI002AC98FD9|nr:hypothetical protein [Actimicrobium sp. CCC2.4]MEB0135912.1 hypothetical protein [Actimicrobium sp. CCC2.4]WPX32579.1 hypothetical protein RHM62_01650 [Actimicrobium sp. CCC2.4]
MEDFLVQPTAIYQRTESGRMEIQLKKLGLTQSERLVLIFVDGRMSLAELKEKLRGLETSRLEKAIDRLATRQLIFEVLMHDASLLSDVLDAVVVDRFLQQDPLDPVTIVSFDAQYEYEYEIAAADHKVIGIDQVTAPVGSVPGLVPVAQQSVGGSSHLISSVDFYVPLEKTQLVSPFILSSTKDTATIQNVLPLQLLDVVGTGSTGRSDLSYLLWRLLVVVGIFLVALSGALNMLS